MKNRVAIERSNLEDFATSEATVAAFIRNVPDELFTAYLDLVCVKLSIPVIPGHGPDFVVFLARDGAARKRRADFERALHVGLGVSAFSASTRRKWLSEAKRNRLVLRAASALVKSATERMMLDPTSRVRGFVRLLIAGGTPSSRAALATPHHQCGEEGRHILEALGRSRRLSECAPAPRRPCATRKAVTAQRASSCAPSSRSWLFSEPS